MKNSIVQNFSIGYLYHVFNRGNNKENIFYYEDNYKYFLKKFDGHLSDLIEVFAYCLIPNHFHFLIRVKETNKNLPGFENLEGLESSDRNPVSQAFSNLFNAYAKALNKQMKRKGSLFQKNVKKKLIDKESYLARIIYYIHLNPVHHKITNDFENYMFSSYRSLLSEKPTKLMRNEVLDLFGGKGNFIAFHKERLKDMNECSAYLLE